MPKDPVIPLRGIGKNETKKPELKETSLRPRELQHSRPPCPSPTPRVHPNSCPSSQWCHPALSSSIVPFSSCSQSLPASETFPMRTLHMRWPKYWSFSFSIIPSKDAHWVRDAMQPFHPLSPPSPPFLNLSQHQGLFQWVSSSHKVDKVLELQL